MRHAALGHWAASWQAIDAGLLRDMEERAGTVASA